MTMVAANQLWYATIFICVTRSVMICTQDIYAVDPLDRCVKYIGRLQGQMTELLNKQMYALSSWRLCVNSKVLKVLTGNSQSSNSYVCYVHTKSRFNSFRGFWSLGDLSPTFLLPFVAWHFLSLAVRSQLHSLLGWLHIYVWYWVPASCLEYLPLLLLGCQLHCSCFDLICLALELDNAPLYWVLLCIRYWCMGWPPVKYQHSCIQDGVCVSCNRWGRV